jgi:hypothetical protein
VLNTPLRHTFTESLLWRTLAAIAFLMGLAVAVFYLSFTGRFQPVVWGFVALFGLLFAYAWLWTANREVTITADGISYRSLVRKIDVHWSDVTETRYSQQSDAEAYARKIPLISALLAQDSHDRRLQIVGKYTISLTSNLQEIDLAIRMVLDSINPRLQKLAEQTMDASGAVSFGRIRLTPFGVMWKDSAPIPYDALVKCRIDGKYLRVKAEGRWSDNIKEELQEIPNVFVLLDMVDARRLTAGLTALQYS